MRTSMPTNESSMIDARPRAPEPTSIRLASAGPVRYCLIGTYRTSQLSWVPGGKRRAGGAAGSGNNAGFAVMLATAQQQTRHGMGCARITKPARRACLRRRGSRTTGARVKALASRRISDAKRSSSLPVASMARGRSPCLRQTRHFSTTSRPRSSGVGKTSTSTTTTSRSSAHTAARNTARIWSAPRSERPSDTAPHQLAARLSQFADVGFLHGILADQESRDLLIKLFAYRTLGYRKVKLPRNTEQYWEDIQAVRSTATTSPPIPIAYMDARLARYDLHRFAYDLQCYGSAAGLACTFVQKQYEYHRGGVVCKAEAGDVAIDAGACWGETTVYFAHEVGAQGRVLSFEFIPTNLAVLRRNLEANLPLADASTSSKIPCG